MLKIKKLVPDDIKKDGPEMKPSDSIDSAYDNQEQTEKGFVDLLSRIIMREMMRDLKK